MWYEELKDGRFKYIERYKDPYTNKNKRVSTILSTNSRQAEKTAGRILNEKIDNILTSKNTDKLTLSQVVDEWKIAHSKNVKERTMKVYARPIIIILDFFKEDTILSNIDARLVQQFFNHISHYSTNTINLIKQPLNLIMDYAVRMDYIDSNPVKKVYVRRNKSLSEKELKTKYLETNKIKEIINEIRKDPQSRYIANFSELLFLTGLRPGEALALLWDNVDFKNKNITIEGTLDYTTGGHAKATVGTPKTHNGYRTVSLSNKAIQILEEEYNYQLANDLLNSFVFVSRKGSHPSINTINRRIKETSQRLFGVTVTSHSMRHAHITLLAELGTPIKAIMDRVGHGDVNTTLKIYSHTTEKISNELVNKLNKLE